MHRQEADGKQLCVHEKQMECRYAPIRSRWNAVMRSIEADGMQ